jgi:hypothetical protein
MEEKAKTFLHWGAEPVGKKIGFQHLVGAEIPVWITCENMDFMPSFAELMAEVINHSPGSADCVREEDICQHQDFHFGPVLSL